MILQCNIKLFPALSNVHKAKTIKKQRFHRKAKRQYKPCGDDDLTGRELLDTIAFAAEFTDLCKLGSFHYYSHLHRCLPRFGLVSYTLKSDKPVMGAVGCRSPPSVLVFFKKIKTEVHI